MRAAPLVVACLTVIAVAGCSNGANGSGTLHMIASGEQAALTGYPVDPGGPNEIAFEDGWSLQFARIVVTVSDLKLQASDGADAMVSDDEVVFDLHKGTPTLWMFNDVPARRWDLVSYRFHSPTAAARNVNEVDADAISRMQTGGCAILMEGTATKGTLTRMLSLCIPVSVHATHCMNGLDMTDGIVVGTGAVTEAQVTFHLDHVFHTSFTVAEPPLRFEPWAATAGADGLVTLDTLASQDITDLRGIDGDPIVDDMGDPIIYDPGPSATPILTLKDYVIAEGITMGHWNGEGHCVYTREP